MIHIPDGKDTASLSETGLLLDTTDSLLEDGRDLSGSSLGVGGVVSGSVDGGGCGISDLSGEKQVSRSPKMGRRYEQRQRAKTARKSSCGRWKLGPTTQLSSHDGLAMVQAVWSRWSMALRPIRGSGEHDLPRRPCQQQRQRRRRASTVGGRSGTY